MGSDLSMKITAYCRMQEPKMKEKGPICPMETGSRLNRTAETPPSKRIWLGWDDRRNRVTQWKDWVNISLKRPFESNP